MGKGEKHWSPDQKKAAGDRIMNRNTDAKKAMEQRALDAFRMELGEILFYDDEADHTPVVVQNLNMPGQQRYAVPRNVWVQVPRWVREVVDNAVIETYRTEPNPDAMRMIAAGQTDGVELMRRVPSSIQRYPYQWREMGAALKANDEEGERQARLEAIIKENRKLRQALEETTEGKAIAEELAEEEAQEAGTIEQELAKV